MDSIILRCVRGAGDREASPISDSLIVTTSLAASRGKRYLDDPSEGCYYQVIERSFKVPHKSEDILPGCWVTVTDSNLGHFNKLVRVKKVSVQITDRSVWDNIDTEEFVDVANGT